ncbi:aldose 1-epimerase family protein [Striga hermonthica]|uniref:Aldose 1-epimerase family protein n=1 Tax=Striga hermonthica TaxID=68872 RepID=A0A9N7R758_STRHE|nr:aldose 1-epimerase family protein [Striga hermonthica]
METDHKLLYSAEFPLAFLRLLVSSLLSGYIKHKLWSLENEPLDRAPSGSRSSSVNIVYRTSDKGSKILACSQGKLTLMPSVKNIGNKAFSFTFATRNSLSISDISEVRVEGLETLDYLDHMMHGKRFTEQADALTFDGKVLEAMKKHKTSKIDREEETE